MTKQYNASLFLNLYNEFVKSFLYIKKRGERIMNNEKTTLMDKLMSKVDLIAAPLARFGQIPLIQSITNGMVHASGITMIGSVFLVLYLFCADGNLTEKALLPFLTPFADDIVLINSLTMSIMAVYMVIAMGAEYAQIKNINKTTGAVGAFLGFILLNYDSVGTLAESGVSGLAINYWGGAGIITAIIAVAISINVLDICYKHNIKITLPDTVPPAIADSFSAIIPYLITTIICWGCRTMLGLNIPELVGGMLLPLLSAADNIFVYLLSHFLASVFWVIGLHGENIVNAVISTFTNTWMIENNAAFVAGEAIPHVWVGNLNRLFFWTSSCWPVLFYMYMSSKKLPHLKPLANICLPSAVFSIIEPIMFGLPVVLNPYLIVPFVLSHTVTGALTYALSSANIIGRFCLELPWATPAPILGFFATGGNFGAALIVVVNFVIGLVIFYPFWKMYEKSEVERIQNQEASAE